MINAFNKKLLGSLIAITIIIVIVTVVALGVIKEAGNADRWVSHTHQVIENTMGILSGLSDAENIENHYLSSGDQRQLDNYYRITNTIKPALSSLRKLVSDNPEEVKNVDSLIKYAGLRLARLNVRLQNKGDRDPARTNIIIARGGEGIYMAHYRQVANTIVANEKKLLLIRQQSSTRDSDIAIGIIFSSAAIVVIVLSFLFLFIARTFRAKEQLRAQLQLSESIFSGAFNYSGIGIALVSLKGEWMDVNPYLLQLFGYTKEELISKTFQDITHSDDLKADMVLLEEILKGELETYKLEKRYYHKEGYIIWGMLTVSLVRYENGAPRFFVSQIEDITANKNLVQELGIKNQVLSQTASELENKITQLEEFNRIVAHNLRGPVGGIEMMVDIVMEEKDTVERGQMLQLIQGSSKSLSATLNDLMKVLEIKLNHDLTYDDCELMAVTQSAIRMVQGEILRARASVHTNFGVTHVRFPKVYLESIFYNMISNALKYRKKEAPVKIDISSQDKDGKINLIFEDNGLGIDLTQYGHQIFKLHKVFHEGYDSKGVGLFITKNQLEAHGGSIEVESEPGVGTRFIISLQRN